VHEPTKFSDLIRSPSVETGNMTKYRNYWIYSIGCFVIWGVLLAVVAAQAKSDNTHTVLLVFAGWCIGWVSTTIARFVYPPPRRWLQPNPPTV
jgi:membrane-associated phospholipid phosphatase